MKKMTMGVLSAGVIYFIWGVTTWVWVPIYDAQFKRLPEEDLVRDTLSVVVQQPGLYMIPSDHKADGSKMSKAEHDEVWRKGPVGMLAIGLNDSSAISPRRVFFSVFGAFLTAFLVGWVLYAARKEACCVFSRTMIAASLGVLTWTAGDFMAWNWCHFPGGYALIALGDRVVGFALIGLVLSKFIPDPESR